MLKRVRQWLRGTPSAASSVVDVARAVAFGDEADARRAAERWALAEKEREETERDEERRAASARQIRETAQREGFWAPPNHRSAEWERWR